MGQMFSNFSQVPFSSICMGYWYSHLYTILVYIYSLYSLCHSLPTVVILLHAYSVPSVHVHLVDLSSIIMKDKTCQQRGLCLSAASSSDRYIFILLWLSIIMYWHVLSTSSSLCRRQDILTSSKPDTIASTSTRCSAGQSLGTIWGPNCLWMGPKAICWVAGFEEANLARSWSLECHPS